MKNWRENEEIKWKWTENEEIKRKWREYEEMRGNGERVRKWSAKQNEREEE